MNSGIYVLRNKVNGKCYIGKSVRLDRRSKEHKFASTLRGRVLRRAYEKYGKDNFEFTVLERCAEEVCYEREEHYIATLKPEYNMTAGGEGRRGPMPEETKALLAQAAREQWAAKTPEERDRVIKHNLTGPRKGHPVTQETRAKLRKATLAQMKANGGPLISRAVVQYTRYTLEKVAVHESIRAAGRAIGIHGSNISANLSGRIPHVRGHVYAYESSKV